MIVEKEAGENKFKLGWGGENKNVQNYCFIRTVIKQEIGQN